MPGSGLSEAGITLLELSPQQASLEDAFMDLTRESLEFQGSTASQFAAEDATR